MIFVETRVLWLVFNQNLSVMKTTAFLLFCIFLGIICPPLSAQKSDKIVITGTVLDVGQSPILNAIVMIDGKKTEVLTDSKGTYKIRVKPDASRIGIFTFGNGIREEDIAGRDVIDFNFSSGLISTDLPSDHKPDHAVATDKELVNTGYSKVKKKNLTSSISKINGTNSRRTYASIYDMIREIPGVQIHSSGVIIQDSRNLFGFIPALYILDGTPVEAIDDIPPSTIESIEVLKGTSAAIYGSRGYGGAILITTKVAQPETK